jgi:hypothetical protein
MKTIKIRYVKRKDTYYIERKGIFGWKRLGYSVDMGYGGFWQSYTSDNKKDLLDQVLEEYYQIDRRFAEIIEYPMIKVY